MRLQPIRSKHILAGVAVLFFSATPLLTKTKQLSPPPPFSQIVIRDTAYTLLIADTPTKKRMGLMYRTYLPESEGMLFVYDTPQPISMWMKNTPLSLDMIWIDAYGKILHIEKETVPFSERILSYHEDAKFVLEINAGESQKNAFSVGDTIQFRKTKFVTNRTQEYENPNPSSPYLLESI